MFYIGVTVSMTYLDRIVGEGYGLAFAFAQLLVVEDTERDISITLATRNGTGK